MASPILEEARDVWLLRAGVDTYCTVQITPFHLVLKWDKTEELLEVALIARAQREASAPAHGARGVRYLLVLYLYTHEQILLGFSEENCLIRVMEKLKERASIGTLQTNSDSVEKLYAFEAPRAVPSEGWQIYNPAAEFKRQGIGSTSKAWRFSTINSDYALIPSYPALLVEPALISDTTLRYAAKHRSKGRIPTLTYLHWAGHGSITRCSQPMVGIKQNRSVQDEKLVDAIFATDSSEKHTQGVYGATSTNLLIDARPTTNAMANMAKGAGTENMEYYPNCKKVYLGVENIHVMRDSLNRALVVLRADTRSAIEGAQPAPLDQVALRRSNWLKHIGDLLDGTRTIVRNVHINASHVLIHCSDGWDRTAQLASLAELCLDPYYRTLQGFAVLIEKDWVSFGHRFQERSGLVGLGADKFDMTAPANEPLFDAEGAPIDDTLVETPASNSFWGFTKHFRAPFQSSTAHERSPIFHQFLDCVAQLQAQFPERFAFNGAFLAEMLRQVYAGSTGTFLYNTDRERRLPRSNGPAPIECTPSVWDVLFQKDVVKQWSNPLYNSQLDDRRNPNGDMGVLIPSTESLRFSSDLFRRSHVELNSRLDSEREEKRRLKERLASAANEPSPSAKNESTDTFDESLQAAATKMRSLFNDGWGRVQGAMKSAGFDHVNASSESNVQHERPRVHDPLSLSTPTHRSLGDAQTRANVPRSPMPPAHNPWVSHPEPLGATEGTELSQTTTRREQGPPPGTTADPLGAWQV